MNQTSDHVVLRDHLVRLLPTKSDVDNQVPIGLTGRNRKILTAIDLHGYLTLEVIDLVYFPSSRPDDRPSTRAYHRLHQLWLSGNVEWIELPVSRVIGGRRPFLCALSRRGVDGRDLHTPSAGQLRSLCTEFICAARGYFARRSGPRNVSCGRAEFGGSHGSKGRLLHAPCAWTDVEQRMEIGDFVQLILVTGATGYIGGRLVPSLLESGYQVRVLVRDPVRLQGRAWAGRVEVEVGDVLEDAWLEGAFRGVSAAYYLVHSMTGGPSFHQRDILAATNFGLAARAAGVGRIIYLGGLGDPTSDLSAHLRSRQDTGAALRVGGVPVTELRAAVVVGAGSVSFEMIRNLTERLPVMICPRWVYTRVQPIGIRDLLAYLVQALQIPESAGQVVEIGGADVLTYGDMMLGYARARGLHRFLLPVPVLTPNLSAYWVHWMTPIPAAIAHPLIEGLRNEVLVRDDAAWRLFPDVHPQSYEVAVRDALTHLQAGDIETTWSDALASSQGQALASRHIIQQGMIMDRRQRDVVAPDYRVFQVVCGLGGRRGWRYADVLWQIRGWVDRLIGGVGLRRGRRDPVELRPGDALDFWRVEEVSPNQRLRLRAEMKLPGQAWLQFEIRPRGEHHSTLIQTAFFAPKGLPGLLYWYGIYPVHAAIFAGLLRGVAADAEASAP